MSLSESVSEVFGQARSRVRVRSSLALVMITHEQMCRLVFFT